MSLRRWPQGYWRAAEDEPASGGKTLSREEYFMQVCRMIRHGQTGAVLYTSVGAGFWVKNLMDALGMAYPPKVVPLTMLGFPCKGIWNYRRNHEEAAIQ